jgi:hypothetical protein
LLDFELDLIALVQSAIALTTNCLEMDEYVFAILTGDESEAFGSVEPFDCSFFHGTFLSVKMTKIVHVMRAEILVCYRCVAMPGLVKIGRSRKEDMVNASTGTTHKRGYVAQPEAILCHQPD